MVGIKDIPDEVVDHMLNNMPLEELDRVSNLPLIGPVAKRRLLKSVVVEPDEKYHNPIRTVIRNDFAVVSLTRYSRTCQMYPRISPDEVRFLEPGDLIELARKNPKAIENVKVEVMFTRSVFRPAIQKFFQEYKKTPVPINSICVETDSHFFDFLELNITKEVEFLDLSGDSFSGFTKLSDPWFPKLTELSVSKSLNPGVVGHFPHKLKLLRCKLHSTGHSTKLALPETLSELWVAVEHIYGDWPHEWDISHLGNLRKLVLLDGKGKHTPRWKLPPGLEELEASFCHMLPNDLASICPNLVELEVTDISKRFSGATPPVLFVPETLRTLKMHSSLIVRVQEDGKSGNLNDKELKERKLPAKVSEWRISGKTRYATVARVDFEKSGCADLSTLSLVDIPKLIIRGQLPRSLTIFTVNSVPTFKFELLESLENLTKLTIVKMECGDFTYSLPESLTSPSFTECHLTSLNVAAPNLTSLKVRRGTMGLMKKETFVLPPGLRELDLSSNELIIIEIDYPPMLETLKMNYNGSMSIGNLPQHLKTFECRSSSLGSFTAPELPRALRVLDLDHNHFSDRTLRELNLQECSNLCWLNLSSNNIETFNPDWFPQTLVYLDLEHNKIASKIGDFSKFRGLKTLGLRSNKLRGRFEEAAKRNEVVFGDRISIVNVEENRLTKADVAALENVLSKKPRLEKLYAGDDLGPNSIEAICAQADKRLKRLYG